jgi:hypothetical protein
MSEGVTEIRINSQPCKGINLTTQHTGPEGTTSGNNSRRGQGDDQGPPPPSAHLPCACLTRHTVGGPYTIPLYTR